MKPYLLSFMLLFIVGLAREKVFSQTQLEMNQTQQNEYQLADQELNKVYQQILKTYKNDAIFLSKLRISQRIWVQFRDAELEMKFPEEDKQLYYGSMYPMCAASYLAKLTRQRTETLKQWLQPMEEGEGCAGSIHQDMN